MFNTYMNQVIAAWMKTHFYSSCRSWAAAIANNVFFFSGSETAVERVRLRMGDFSTASLIFVLHRKVLPRSLKLLPPPAFSPKWRSYLGQTIPSPWTLIQCTLFCRGGRNGPTSGSSTPLSQNATVCGGLYGLLCLWGPSPTPLCWMSAPWLSSGSFAPRKWGEEGEEKERGLRGRGRERAVNGTIT